MRIVPMTRNNVTKVKAKKTINKTKTHKKAKTSSSIQSMEKEFKNMPAKLIQQLRKEATVLKKQESNINLSLKKMQKQKKLIANQQAILLAKAQGKKSESIKKQLLTIKKNNDKLNHSMTKLTSDLEKIENQLTIVSEKQAQFTYISKEVAQLDKRTKSKSPTKLHKKLKPNVQPLDPQDTKQPIQELIDSAIPQTTEMES
jgi:hypothetical protein